MRATHIQVNRPVLLSGKNVHSILNADYEEGQNGIHIGLLFIAWGNIDYILNAPIPIKGKIAGKKA